MSAMRERPVLIMAGGTGGHVFPGLAVAVELQSRKVPVVWLGASGGMEEKLVPEHGIAFEAIAVRGVRGKGLGGWLALPFRMLGALRQARAVLRRRRPRSVVSFGGYAAGPGGLAAWLMRIPLVVHEQNAIAGLTNRVLARLARRALCGFADALPKSDWSGNPVRGAIAALPPPEQRLAGRTGPLRLLVLGGSLGARALNRVLPELLVQLEAEGLSLTVRHQSGARLLDETRAAYAAAGLDAQPEAFIADMAAAYADADLVLCRAGALTLAELCAAGIGSVLVPYPHAVDDHQTANARALVGAGAALLLPEDRLSASTLHQQLAPLLADRAPCISMARAARTLAKTDAAQRVAQAALDVAGGAP